MDKLQRGDELPPGVMKMVKVFIAVKSSCSPATKWPAATAIKAWSLSWYRLKTCRSSRMAHQLISC